MSTTANLASDETRAVTSKIFLSIVYLGIGRDPEINNAAPGRPEFVLAMVLDRARSEAMRQAEERGGAVWLMVRFGGGRGRGCHGRGWCSFR
jgi:hypothetical protein